MTDDFIKWFAGFVDGEGCIGLRKSGGYYYPYFVVSNTNKDVIFYIKTMTGIGQVQTRKRADIGCKDCYNWYVSSTQEVVDLCSKLKPYLRVRKLQAETVLEYFFDRDNAETYVNRIRELNKKGI